MGTVVYNNSRIIPAPFVSVTRSFNKTGDGTILGQVFDITLNGEIVAHKGSPTSSGTFHTTTGYPVDETIASISRLGALLRKEGALRDLFSDEGKSLELQSLDATAPMRCNPRIINIDFAQGTWFNTVPYTITLQADELLPTQEIDLPYPSAYISDFTETWAFDTEDTATNLDNLKQYRLNHSVSAVGKRSYDAAGNLTREPWQHASGFVVQHMGLDGYFSLSSGIHNLPTYFSGYNYIRSTNTDKTNGAFSLSESWIISSGAYIEDFNINVSESLNSFTSVSIQGSIQGLETYSSSGVMYSKYSAASVQFVKSSGLALSRAQAYSGKSLNIEPLTISYGINPLAGNINYTFEFDDRPSRLITGTKSEVISTSNQSRVDMVATIPVLGRTRGSLIQPLSTKQPCEQALTIELFFPSSYVPSGTAAANRMYDYNPRLHAPQSGDIISIILASDPIGHAFNNIGEIATSSNVMARSETWSPSTMQYTLNMTWLYE